MPGPTAATRSVRRAYGRLTGSALHGVATLSAATLAAQGIVVAVSPLVTRLYSPAELGTFAFYLSILTAVSAVAAGRFELALALPADERTAANLLGAALVVICIVVAGLFGAVGIATIGGLDMDAYFGGGVRWLLPLGVVALTTYQCLSYWMVRHEDFSTVARTRLTQGTGLAAGQVGLGIAAGGSVSLVLADLLGRTVGIGRLIKTAVKRHGEVLREVSVKGMERAASRYRRFPLLLAPTAWLNVGALQAPAVALLVIYGAEVAGWYSLAQRVVALPLTLVGQSVAQVYLGRAASLRRNRHAEELRAFFLRVSKRLAMIALIVAAIIVLLAPPLFEPVFGDSWSPAGEYVRLLAPMLAVQLLVVPISQTLNLMERQAWQAAWDFGRLCIVLSAFASAAGLGLEPAGAVGLYSGVMSVCYIVLLFLSRLALRREGRPRPS